MTNDYSVKHTVIKPLYQFTNLDFCCSTVLYVDLWQSYIPCKADLLCCNVNLLCFH